LPVKRGLWVKLYCCLDVGSAMASSSSEVVARSTFGARILADISSGPMAPSGE